MGEWKQLGSLFEGAAGIGASQFHPTPLEGPGRRSTSLIRQSLLLDQEDAFAAGEIGFLARALVQATLLHSDPKENEFVRRNGHFTLSIFAPKDVGLPYGRYPRLVLAFLTTEAVRRKSKDIELGSDFSHFCATLGIPSTTGPQGSLPKLREQLQRLRASTFQCIFHDERSNDPLERSGAGLWRCSCPSRSALPLVRAACSIC